MAYVLSLRPQSPLKRSFSDNPCLTSCSPLKDTILGPQRDVTARNVSACSLYSLASSRIGYWSQNIENTPPLASQSLLNLVPEHDGSARNIGPVIDESCKRNSRVNQHPLVSSRIVAPSAPYSRKAKGARNAPKSSSSSGTSAQAMNDDNDPRGSELFKMCNVIHIPLPERMSSDTAGRSPHTESKTALSTLPVSSQPFRRWMSTLRRRHAQRRKSLVTEVAGLSGNMMNTDSIVLPLPNQLQESTRRMSDSISSSMGCVTAMKSASMTIASASIVPRSDVGFNVKGGLTNRSSNFSEARRSLESHRGTFGPIIDESAWLRSLQRRKVVEELIASEESYIADLKVLINDYFMIISTLPTLPGQLKSSIQQNITQILHIHEDLLAELHQAIPQADFTHSANQESYPVTKAKHIRFHSADIIPGRFAEHKATRRLRHSLEIGRSPDRRPRGLVTDTKTVREIAKIFNKHMKRFFTYEEYGAHWTTMSQDLNAMCKGLHGWQDYERGIEALQNVIASENNRDAGRKKALSFPDLLIKPIQRVCKYPLLFDDLCRHTPVYDDPEAHAELEKTLFRLQETIREINKAKDDPEARRLIEITWQLQDRLAFQEQKLSQAFVFRMLGHVLLCGVLHVAFQTPERVKGQYMICILYKSCLVLATASRFHTPYNVVASIGLANGSIEEADNGRVLGIQCHTAPHTWKFLFEHGHRLHEIVLSACTSQEEEVWKKKLHERIVYETHDFIEGQSTMQDMFSSLNLDIKSLGPVFGHAKSLVRRMSVHRAATLGAKTNVSQVIIKNTQAQKTPDLPPTFSPSTVTRSQSYMSANHVPTLAPRRTERIRLEYALEEMWTKDALPFPGMSNRRVENQIRASANSVMRKLSMASIASNFSRRSPSLSSISYSQSEDSFGNKVHKVSHSNLRARSAISRRPAPTVVDFHNAPAAFLPTDFDLQDKRPCSRRRRLANRAVGAEVSNDMVTIREPKKARRLSTNIISLPRPETSNRTAGRTTSRGSDIIVLRTLKPSMDFGRASELERQKATAESSDLQVPSLGKPPSNKFLRSKSKVFKFWA
ncbi:hypothetical protein BKA66DRAFT_438839 [Pyrenochaeta sp. MPI-SDFR-AT-0127]|nr:hypothetical protein BKA66DRAFT_438839 [Pyrenochaeta sp. MPI-SDFR-AT-0127]